MALDKLTLIDDTVISTTVTTAVNNLAQTNYITYPIATGNPLSNGWRVYKNTDTVAPTTGIAGSPSIALTQNTDNPLNSTGDFRITKTSGASRRGEGISTDFTIANRHLAKILQISFDYEVIVGSTLATDDIRVYIIQDPSSGTPVIIEPVNVSVQGVVSGNRMRHLATFQTHISVASYRLCIHIATTTNSNQTIDFNGFRVWEPSQTIGSIITDWQSFTMIITGTTSAPTKATNRLEVAHWRRVGGNLEIIYNYEHTNNTGAAAGSGSYIWLLPNGLKIDTAKTANGTINATLDSFGNAQVSAGSSDFVASVTKPPGRDDGLYLVYQTSVGNIASVNSLAAQLTNTTARYSFTASVPIAGWGSNVAMSSDTGDGRVVAAKYNNNTNGATTSNTQPIFWGTREYDTHNAVTIGTAGSTYASGNSWKFIAPISGYYRVTISCALNSSPGGIAVWRNNSRISYLSYNDTAANGSGTLELNAGDILDVRTDSPVTTDSGTTRFISIERISAGSQQIAVTETVACSYHANSGGAPQTSPSTTLKLPTRIYDTHGAWGITTGQFTAPMSGKYRVTLIGVLGGGQPVQLFRQNAPYCWMGNSEWTTGTFSSSCEVDLLAGNVIDIRTSNGPSGATAWGGGTLGNNSVTVISISRIGM